MGSGRVGRSIAVGMGLLFGFGPLMAQLPEAGPSLLEGAATAGDEIVLGTDGWQVVVLAGRAKGHLARRDDQDR